MIEFCSHKSVDDMSLDEIDLLLEEITTIGPSITRSFNGRRSVTCRMKCGWSPTVRALNAQLTCFIEARRRFWGFRGRRRWSSSQRIPGITLLVEQWVACVDSMTWNTDGTGISREMVLNRTGRTPDYWYGLTTLDPEDLKCEIIRLQHLLGSRKRHQYRLELSAKSAAREEAIQSGKIGAAIKSIVGKPSTSVELTWLRVSDDGDMIMDPKAILRHLNEKFYEWHSGDADSISGIHVQRADWHRIGTDRSLFDNLVKQYGIPAYLLDHIWAALRSKESALEQVIDGTTLRERLGAAISEPPSLKEFKDAVKNAKGGVTSGMSGLTYDILNCWPDEAIEMAYNAILKIKTAGRQPKHWTWKWITPIPKNAGDNSLDNIRPISLVEVLRKVWSGIRVSKIWHLVEKHGLLHSSQHGYRRRKGTDSMTIQLLDIMEQIRESQTDLALASWDTVRAFDSISRVLAMISLHRVGVPVKDCEDMINIDEDGAVFVKCPHSTKVWQRKISSCPRGRTYAKVGKSSAPPFKAVRGIGQGDNHSPLTWILFEDIILCALENVRKDPLYKYKVNGDMQPAKDLCYADDLLTVSGQLSGLQAKADLMSAFALIFKLKFNKPKLRLFLQESGVFKDKTSNPFLVIRENHWNNTCRLPLSIGGEFKSLGFIHNLGGPGTQFPATLSYVNKVCKIISTKLASPTAKILALNVHLFNKTSYVGQYGSWPLETFEKLDIPVQALLRKITRNLPSHPNRLLYMNRNDGGLQLRKLSDHCQFAKYALLHRSLLADEDTRDSINNLLLRSARRMGAGLSGGRLSLRPHSSGPFLWVDSLVDWLKGFGLSLSRGGHGVLGADTAIANSIDEPQLQKKLLKLTMDGVVSWGDLVNGDCKKITWLDPKILGTSWLANSLPPEPPEHPLSPRVGQFWRLAVASMVCSGEVVEIIGLLSQEVIVKVWKLAGSVNLSAGADLVLVEQLTLESTSVMFCELRKCSRIYVTGPRLAGGRCLRTITHVVRQFTPKPFKTAASYGWSRHAASLLGELAFGDYDMFTDGSWSETGEFINRLFSFNTSERATGGFCVMKSGVAPTGKILAVHITNDTSESMGSAGPMELMSIVAALSLTKLVPGLNKLYSDSKSSLDLLSRPGRFTYWCRKANLPLLREGIDLSKGSQLEHIRSHVERRKKDKATWTPQEWGNYIADKVADGDEVALTDLDVIWVRITASQILNNIGDNCWYLSTAKGIPSLNALEQSIASTYKTQYLSRRDLAHAMRLGLPSDPPALYWRDATIRLAAKVWDMSSKKILMAARAQRTIFDKFWFSWNAHKSDSTVDVTCPLCLQPDSLSHLVQHCPDPVCEGIRNDGLEEILGHSLGLHPDSKWLVQAVVNMARYNPRGQLIYTGMWNSELRDELLALALDAGHNLSESLLKQWRLVLDDISHSLVLISHALISYRLAGSNPGADYAIDDRIRSERCKRMKLVRDRRLKSLQALDKKRQGGAKADPQVSDDELLEFLLAVNAEVNEEAALVLTPDEF